MQLLAPHVKKSRPQPIFAGELLIKMQRARECFLGSALPFPTTKVIAAWNDLPNVMVDNLSTTVKTELPFIRAPPPTPTGSMFITDGPTPNDPSSSGSHDDGWLLVDDTTLSTSDVGVVRALDGSAADEDDLMLHCGHAEQLLDRQTQEEDSLRSTDSNILSSDEESFLSRGAGSPTSVEFNNMVSQWLSDYRARGTDAFIESLVAFGVMSVGAALVASRIARAVVKRVTRISYNEGKSLEKAVRFSVLAAFEKHWEVNDTSMEVPSTGANTAPPTSYGINIASLMGSLFNEKISPSKDIHLCLALLLEGEKRFDRLCAMHALLVRANDKLCKNRNLPALMQFRDGITSISGETGEYLWTTTPHSKVLLADILALIERWIASQAHRREQSRISSLTGNRTIRSNAVGPRLRNGLLAGLQ